MIRPIFEGMTERLYPVHHKTLGAIRDAGLRLHAFCLREGCGWHADLDIDDMIARLGERHSSRQPDIVPKLICSQCGGKEIAVELTLAKEVPDAGASYVKGARRGAPR